MATDLKTAQQMLDAAMAARPAEDPELASLKRVLMLLDKTAKSNRTYGATNPVAQKFAQQLFAELSQHLNNYSKLTFLVQRSELLYKEHVIYQASKDGGSENLAFKLYADGIREVAFHQELTQDDLSFFLVSLWGEQGTEEADDDIVTRLWSRNLETLTIVTAEELSKTAVDSMLNPDGSMSSSDSTLRELLNRELERKKRLSEKDTAKKEGVESSQSRFQSGLAGYEVTEVELAALLKEIDAESKQDSVAYILDALMTILASEQSAPLLTKLFGLWNHIVDALLREGKWTVLKNVLSLLQETDAIRPDLSQEHKQEVRSILEGLGRTERVKLIETYLNVHPEADTNELLPVLLMMNADAVPAFCSLLASLTSPAHQAIVVEALTTLAKDRPEPLLKGLTDRRPTYVRHLLSILIGFNNPALIESIEKVIRYPDAQVRRDVLRAISLFRPSGNGAKLIPLTIDEDENVRFATLKLLMSGQYTAAFSAWSPILEEESFMDRPISERRAFFQAVRSTSRDEAIPYWQNLLLTSWSWTGRKKKEESGVLAAETLGKLATPAAISTLELGIKKGGAAIRQACTIALAQAHKLQRGKTPVARDVHGDPS